MVEITANELSQDLGAGLAAPHPAQVVMSTAPVAHAPINDALIRRIEALEQTCARQDRVFRRLMDLLGAMVDR
jgi:hypothetical protein